MALLNRFSRLNDRGETGIFTFIVTKSVTRDFHRDATTKDFCFGYHRWAISFQRPSERVLGVHLLLRNPSPNTSCVVDFTLTLLNRQHFSQNQVFSKRQAKFTITNPMQGVSRWIQMSDLIDRRFSNETGEFLFELSLSNMTTIFECDIQLNPSLLTQYKSMLLSQHSMPANGAEARNWPQGAAKASSGKTGSSEQLISLETNYFTFGAFDWSLTILPLVIPCHQPQQELSSSRRQHQDEQLTSSSSLSISSGGSSGLQSARKSIQPTPAPPQEPVCRVYLNRLTGYDCLCRVKYRVILGHHQPGANNQAEFVDSKTLDQVSNVGGRIRGHQFRNTNMLKLISLRTNQPSGAQYPGKTKDQSASSGCSSLDLRVHIEMFCANIISEARVALERKPSETQASNCSDRNKQAWCVEADSEGEHLRLKLFFMDIQSVPRNHIRYISWCAYVVKRDPKSGTSKESIVVLNSPHSNYYLQDGIDLGTIMETDIPVKEINNSPKSFLDANQLLVHIEWIDSLLLFSHLYNNYDSLATIQRHQISRELCALEQEFEHLELKYEQNCKTLEQLMNPSTSGGQQRRQSASPPPARSSPVYTPKSFAGRTQSQLPDTKFSPKHLDALPLKEPSDSGSSSDSPHAHSALEPVDRRWLLDNSKRYPNAPANPMSHSERLQLSSSTPPDSIAHRRLSDSAKYLHEQLASPASNYPSGPLSQCVRRRLPRHPASFKAAPSDTARHKHRASHPRRVTDSPTAYSMLSVKAGLLAGGESSPPTTSHKIFESAIDNEESIIELHYGTGTNLANNNSGSGSSNNSIGIYPGTRISSMLMMEEPTGSSGHIDQIDDDQVERYQHQPGTLSSAHLQSLPGRARTPSPSAQFPEYRHSFSPTKELSARHSKPELDLEGIFQTSLTEQELQRRQSEMLYVSYGEKATHLVRPIMDHSLSSRTSLPERHTDHRHHGRL